MYSQLSAGGVVGVLSFAGEEAGTAVDRSALRGIEGYCRLLSALSALDRDFYSLPDSGGLCRGNSSQSLILSLLAGLATLGLILQSLVMKEGLLARRPDEILIAVYTPDGAIRVLNFGAFGRLKGFFPFRHDAFSLGSVHLVDPTTGGATYEAVRPVQLSRLNPGEYSG